MQPMVLTRQRKRKNGGILTQILWFAITSICCVGKWPLASESILSYKSSAGRQVLPYRWLGREQKYHLILLWFPDSSIFWALLWRKSIFKGISPYYHLNYAFSVRFEQNSVWNMLIQHTLDESQSSCHKSPHESFGKTQDRMLKRPPDLNYLWYFRITPIFNQNESCIR